MGSDHLPILLTVPLSLLLYPIKRLPSFNFQKACLDDFAFYFDSHCPSAEEYFFLSLFPAAALFTSLARNVAKCFITFDHVKCQPQTWWSPKVDEAVSVRHKTFAATHRSDEDH